MKAISYFTSSNKRLMSTVYPNGIYHQDDSGSGFVELNIGAQPFTSILKEKTSITSDDAASDELTALRAKVTELTNSVDVALEAYIQACRPLLESWHDLTLEDGMLSLPASPTATAKPLPARALMFGSNGAR